MSNKVEELKKINAQKKELAEKQKILRGELEATREQRKINRAIKAKCRVEVKELKAKLALSTSSIYFYFSKDSVEEIEQLADDVMEVASKLAGVIRKFAEASKDPDSDSSKDTESGEDTNSGEDL